MTFIERLKEIRLWLVPAFLLAFISAPVGSAWLTLAVFAAPLVYAFVWPEDAKAVETKVRGWFGKDKN